MKLQLISRKEFKGGLGNRRGDSTEEFYKCPCGKGQVFFESDDYPGNRYKSHSCDCAECEGHYTFKSGTAIPK